MTSKLSIPDSTTAARHRPLPEDFPDQQWVCTACGFNMIGDRPDVCPFCGARHDRFMDWDAAERRYRVQSIPVTSTVTQLVSSPRLGLEHAGYRVETSAGTVWIDCPSAFNRDLSPVSDIYFTHQDFLGASNQYRSCWNARVHLHALDAAVDVVSAFPVDDPFQGDFQQGSLQAFHIGGHTPGFTIYFHGEVLFACDYAFPPGPRMRLNPFSPADEIRIRGQRLLELARDHRPEIVCGFNYLADGRQWLKDFENVLQRDY